MNRFLLSIIISILLIPATADDTVAQRTDARAFNEILGDQFIAENVRSIRRAAAALDPADRYEFLASWILPGSKHPDFRIAGEFTPTDPSPPAVRLEPERFPEGRGGGLASPVFDLLDTAAELGRLEELRARIADTPEPLHEFQQRVKATLLLLVNLELGDDEAAAKATDTLNTLAIQATPESVEDMWPETLALHRGFQYSHPIPALRNLLGNLYAERTSRSLPPGCEHWHARIAYLMEHSRRLAERPDEPTQAAVPDDWVPVHRLSFRPRGDGYPHTLWRRDAGNVLQHLRGHHEDYLFFRRPLRGDFEVAGEMGIDGTTQFFAAGKYFGPRGTRNELETGTFRQGSAIENIAPSFSKLDPWVSFRAVISDRVRTIYLNGRPVHTEELPEHHVPWFGVRAWSRAVARVRNVQVTGEPRIPDEVHMSASTELVGWVPYFDESAGHEDATWRHVENSDGAGEIHGLRHDLPEGCFFESLLGYHRPLVEDGAVEYEFFYEPGRTEAHPAIDRLVFLLAPQGVRIHWITDGKFDRTDVPPDNVFDEPRNRRGPATLPLRPGEWNRVRLSLSGDVAALELNGQQVYERELEPTNRRTFGLFHFADRAELRVRNVLMRADWPKSLPPPGDQHLVDPLVAALDADLPELASVFTHDFAMHGAPEKYFSQADSDRRGRVVLRPEGLFISRPAAGRWTSLGLTARFLAHGDFDFEAEFDNFHADSDYYGCVMLVACIDDDKQHHCRLIRTRPSDGNHKLDASVSELHPDGTRTYPVRAQLSCDAVGGRLRLARRGNVVHYLFAERGSDVFRLFASENISERPTHREGVQLRALCDGTGEAGVVWKSVTLRAELLKHVPPEDQAPQRALHVMNDDGSGLRELTPPPEGFTHLGSPEWSPDGSRIALDVSRGSTTTSHIFVVDVESGESTDLGPGCMPSFSNDGSRIVFSQPGQGVMMMDADGTGRRVIDSAGWGVQWSPDGKHIAYGKSGNIVLRDVAADEQQELLRGEDATRYSSIYWNLGWSHDSRSIAFKARRRQTGDDELAVVDVDPPHRFRALHSAPSGINADFTWSPDSEQVLFAMHAPGHDGPRLYLCRHDEPRDPMLLPDHPPDVKIFDCAWSPDGLIAFTGERIPQPVNWPPGGEPERRSE